MYLNVTINYQIVTMTSLIKLCRDTNKHWADEVKSNC